MTHRKRDRFSLHRHNLECTQFREFTVHHSPGSAPLVYRYKLKSSRELSCAATWSQSVKWAVERALSLGVAGKLITVFHRAPNRGSPHTSQGTKRAWTIDDAVWREVWSQAATFSVCNRSKSTQFRIVHRTPKTPVVKNKMEPVCHGRLFHLCCQKEHSTLVDAPTLKLWHEPFMECIPSDYVTRLLSSRLDAFYQTWVLDFQNRPSLPLFTGLNFFFLYSFLSCEQFCVLLLF